MNASRPYERWKRVRLRRGRDPSLKVFAVEDSSLQLSWPALPRAQMSIEVGDRTFDVDSTAPAWCRSWLRRPIPVGTGGPGSLVVCGLQPGTRYEVRLRGRTGPPTAVAAAQTLPEPPGRLLFRFATVSDCHIGERRFGLLHTLHDPRPRPKDLAPYPVRALVAAIAEAEAWGAEMIVAKGDLTGDGRRQEAEDVATLLASATVPVHALLGNHDVRGSADVDSILLSHGIHAGRQARAIDAGGATVVLGHSPIPGRHVGRLEREHTDELVSLARAGGRPVVVALHHPPRRVPVSTYYPPAITWRDTRRLTRGLAATGLPALMLAGHTHRNRRYRVGGVDVAEVGSTKDYPGQWAGYAVYEGGIRQVVRRISQPDVIAWTEMTARALGGVWGWWSPGSLDDRCWTITW